MKYLILLATLFYSFPGHSQAICPVTSLKNFPAEPTQGDLRAYDSAVARCVYHYPKSPCLVQFDKVGPNDYHATCGAKR